MTYRDRVEEIAGIVRGVAESGVVHARRRNTPDWAKFILFFRDPTGIVNGWQVSRRGPSSSQAHRWEETYQLDKFTGLRDADETEFPFQQNLDDVAREFVEGRDLSFGSVAEGIQITEIDERMFGGVLCHYAACLIKVSLYTQDL